MHSISEAELPADLKALLRLWQHKAGVRRFPAPHGFSDADLLPWDGRVHLVELLDDGDLWFRRFGHVSAGHLGYDPTGRRLSEFIYNERVIVTTRTYRRCLTLGRPVCDHIPRRFDDGRWHPAYDRLMLPCGLGDRASLLLVGVSFRPEANPAP